MLDDDKCCRYDPANWVLTPENPSANIVFFEVLRPGLSVYAAIHRIHNESKFEVLVETLGGQTITLLPQNSIDVSSLSITLRAGKTKEKETIKGTYRLLCCTLAGEKESEVNFLMRVVGDAGQPLTIKMLP